MDPRESPPGRPAPPPSRRFLLAALLILLALSAYVVGPFLAAVLFALLFGYLLQGVLGRVERRVRSRRVAAAIVLLAVAVALVLPIVFITLSLVEQATVVAQSVDEPGELQARINEISGRLGLPEGAGADLAARVGAGAIGFLQGLLVPTINAVLEVFTGLVVFFFLLYYILVDGPLLLHFLRQNIPLVPRHRERLLRDSGQRVRAILLGAIAVSVIQGIAAGIGWWLLGFPNPVFWGFVMTILAVLPFAGPILIMGPAAVIAMAQGDVLRGVLLLGYAIVVVGLVDNFARPFIVGRSADVHPGIILVGTLGGIMVFGVSGFVLGPLIMGLVPPVLEVWHDAATGDEPDPPLPEVPPAELPPA